MLRSKMLLLEVRFSVDIVYELYCWYSLSPPWYSLAEDRIERHSWSHSQGSYTRYRDPFSQSLM